MRTTLRILKIFFLLTWVLPSFGQTNLLLPGKGIEGISVVLDSSNISDVIKQFGDDYLISTTTLVTYYQYNKKGLTFQINPYDKNQIVRSISVESPFQAKVHNGIVLNESTMNEVWKLYNENGCFTSRDYAWRPQKGISFYIKRDPSKKGFNPKEKISKIEIHNDGEFGTSSRVNFEFNNEPVERKLQELISILKADIIDFKRLDSFWQNQKKTEKEPYGLEKKTNFERKIEYDLSQEYVEIRIARNSYNLNIIKSHDNLIYLRLSNQVGNQIILERNEIAKISNLLTKSERKLDTSIILNYPFIVYTYGTLCGIGGTPPEKCQMMLTLVEENKYNELATWLHSINPEIATYGYIGLDFLKRKGKEISLPELKRMTELSKSQIQLNTCQGCYFGVTEKISDILKEKNLNTIYKSFLQADWIK
ncbi:hypothetical protein AD998_17500 [bacterium 336/3]|nr:hypothetical protein AD998_17500 [bacterium 336/3]